MAQTSIHILFPQTSAGADNLLRGTKSPAASYYLGNADLQTVSWSLTNVIGIITIQASLVTDPVLTNDNDWFPVYTKTCSSTTETGYTNISGNFVWIRAKIAGFTQGTIQNIKLTY